MSESAFQCLSFATTDVDEAHTWLRQAYTDFSVQIHGSEDDFSLSVDRLRVGTLGVSHLRHTMAVEMVSAGGLDWPGIYSVRRPTLDVEVGHRQVRLGASNPIAMPIHERHRASWHALDADTIELDPVLLNEVAAGLTAPGKPVRLEFGSAISPVAGAQWTHTVALVPRVALANVANPHGSLLAGELSMLLTTAALTCFANTTMTDSPPTPARVTPASVRRAVAYIDTHLDRELSLASIAEAARVSPRALNTTFNRYHGTSVMAYVRRARMDRAHHDLKAAHPGDGASVTAIAARWGFYSLPRFGVAYRRAYGQPPSQTLRRT